MNTAALGSGKGLQFFDGLPCFGGGVAKGVPVWRYGGQRMAEQDDERIDTSDIPELDETFFEKAELRVPAKQPVTLRIDEDVLTCFKAQGKGYQTRINKLLRQYMENQVHRR